MLLPSETSSLACLDVCRLGRIQSLDSQVGELLGREPESMRDLPFTALLEPECVHDFLQQLWTSFRYPGRQLSSEVVVVRPDSSRMVVLLFTRVQPGEDDPNCQVALAHLPPASASEEWRQLFERLPYGIVWMDSEECVVGCNPALCELLGFLPHQLDRQRIEALFFDWSSEAAMTAGLQRCSFRVQGLRRDGIIVPVEAYLYPVDPSFSDRAYLLTVRDLRQQESLERRSLRMAELERQSVGRNLHDALGQSLIGMAFLADELSASLAREDKTDRQRNAEMAQRLARLCRETCELTRTLVRGLVPIGLADGSLAEALRDLANSCSTIYGIECRADCLPIALPADISSHLFRIAQEATTNALKHSGCDKLRIVLSQKSDIVMLTVQDNGKGISNVELQRFGSGLHSIRHRCRLIGARLSLAQPSQGGTGVSVAWPIPKSAPLPEPPA